MRTYDKLENYHYEMIKDKNLEKGTKVWVARTNFYGLNVAEAMVNSFGIHFEGEIEVRVKFKKIPGNDWNANPREYELTSLTVFMYQVYHTKKEAEAFLKIFLRNKITRLQESAKYYEKQLDNLTV